MRKKFKNLIFLLTISFFIGGGGFYIPAWSISPEEILQDPALEKRARHISADLRCLVCQNQTIDDSDATLARDLRKLVRERLLAGDSNDDVRKYVHERYGDFVLMTPPFDHRTAILWLAPFLLLGAGLLLIKHYRRLQKEKTLEAPLSQDEEEKLKKILEEAKEKI